MLQATEDSELVRRRGRWASHKVMEIYLQEVASSTFVLICHRPRARRLWSSRASSLACWLRQRGGGEAIFPAGAGFTFGHRLFRVLQGWVQWVDAVPAVFVLSFCGEDLPPGQKAHGPSAGGGRKKGAAELLEHRSDTANAPSMQFRPFSFSAFAAKTFRRGRKHTDHRQAVEGKKELRSF